MIEHDPQQPIHHLNGWLADELQLQMKEYDTLRRYGPKDGPARTMTFEQWRDHQYELEKTAIPDQAPARASGWTHLLSYSVSKPVPV